MHSTAAIRLAAVFYRPPYSPSRCHETNLLSYNLAMRIRTIICHRGAVTVLLLATVTSQSVAQQQNGNVHATYSPKLLAELNQLRDAALASDYAYVELAYLCINIVRH